MSCKHTKDFNFEDRRDVEKPSRVKEINRYQPEANLNVGFIELCTGEPYQSSSSLTSGGSASEKIGSACNGLLVKSRSSQKTNASRSDRKREDNDLGLISATTSPYRSEWENKNRPFSARFYPFSSDLSDNRERQKEKFISVVSSEKSPNGFSSGHESCSPPSVINSRQTDTLINIREAEKDRLARIFAYSSVIRKTTCKEPHSTDTLSQNDERANGSKVKTRDELVDDLVTNRNIELIKSPTIFSEQFEPNCKNSCCRLERQISDKEVQTGFNDYSTPLQLEIYPNKLDLSPSSRQNLPTLKGQCYSNKEIQTLSDEVFDKLKQSKFVPQIIPEKLCTDPKVICVNDKENLSPRRFVTADLKNEDKTAQFSPLYTVTSPNSNIKRMVKIGEFSPLNPKLNSPGHALMGLGEYEERRKLLMEQRKHEYCQYLEQARLVAKSNQEMKKALQTVKPTEEESDLRNVKDAATQTDCESPLQDFTIKFQSSPFHTHTHGQAPDSEQNSKMCELSDVQLRQFLYREELRKQIEERQRIEAEKREKERLEEEAMEAKIKQQQEEMQSKYEAEIAERMQLALKKKEQEEALYIRLAEMEKQTLEDKKQLRRHQKNVADLSPRNVYQQDNPSKRPERDKAYRTPESTSLSFYRQERDKIFKEIADIERQYSGLQEYVGRHLPVGDKLTSAAPIKESFSEPVSRRVNKRDSKNRAFTVVRSVDFDDHRAITRIARQRAEVEEILSRPLIESIPPHPISPKPQSVNTKATILKETADDILNQPLLSSDNEDIKDVRDMIPLLPRSNSPPIPAATTRARTNSDTLDDKWKIPAVEKYKITPLDIHSNNNRSVLTQLGAFRKHLQQEQMLMARDLKSKKERPS